MERIGGTFSAYTFHCDIGKKINGFHHKYISLFSFNKIEHNYIFNCVFALTTYAEDIKAIEILRW